MDARGKPKLILLIIRLVLAFGTIRHGPQPEPGLVIVALLKHRL
jgi:hypothetical protein